MDTAGTGRRRGVLPGHARTGPGGVAVLVLVLVFMSILLVAALFTSFQESATARAYGRALLDRSCLEAAGSALSEACVVIRESLVQGAPVPGSAVDFKRMLLPPQAAAGRSGQVEPVLSRRIFADPPHRLHLSDVTSTVIAFVDGPASPDSLVRARGILELGIEVSGSVADIKASRTVRQRLQFYAKSRAGAPRGAALSPSTADVFVVVPPLCTTIE